MTPEPRCVGTDQTLAEAAVLMRDLDVGALPICGTDGKLAGMVTDRDIVVTCVADGKDPSTTTVALLAQGVPVSVDVAADLEEVVTLMREHQVRRLPVLDQGRLVGIIAQADVALTSAREGGEVVEGVSEPTEGASND